MPNSIIPPCPPEAPYYLDLAMTPADGIAKCGQPIKLSMRLYCNGEPASGVTLRCVTKWESRECARKDFALDGSEVTVEYCSDKPGWVYFSFYLLDAQGQLLIRPGNQVTQRIKRLQQPEILHEIGAIYEPERIIAAPSCPDDFDAFWDGETKRLEALPMAVRLTEATPEAYVGKLKAFSLEINCLGHYPVTGYLAFPANAQPGTLPACLDMLSMVWQDAPLEMTCAEALANNALEMFLSWHGQPTGMPDQWYDSHQNDYYQPYQDINDPVKWTMHDMFLRVLRGLQYLKQRPEWNRTELVVRGGSLAGIESIALAALDKDIDVALINVPTGCEFNAQKSGRGLTWMFHFTGRPELLDDPVCARTLAYHDGVNFAHRITCETYVCTGLADEVCFPSNVCAFYNAITNASSKKLSITPTTGHFGTTVNTTGNSRLAKLFKNVTVSQNKC